MTPLWAIYFCSFDFFCCFWWCLWGVDTMATLRDYMCDHFDAASFQRKKKNGIAATVPNERPRERVTRQCYADQESGTSTEQVPMKRSCSIRRSHPKLGQCTTARGDRILRPFAHSKDEKCRAYPAKNCGVRACMCQRGRKALIHCVIQSSVSGLQQIIHLHLDAAHALLTVPVE